MTDSTTDCCDDLERASRLSRRRFLAGMAATSGTVVATTMFGDAVRSASFALGSAGTANNVVVVLSLRGGIDGLGLVVPHGDPGYYTARPTIAVPAASLVAADAMFGLHPKMAPLSWLWDAGELAAVHAVGQPVPNRSHFSAIEQIEDADPGGSERQGWIDRMVGLTATDYPVTAVQLGTGVLPTALTGPAAALAAGQLSQLSVAGATSASPQSQRRRQQLETVWAGPVAESTPALQRAFRTAIETVDTLAPALATKYQPTAGVTYPAGTLAAALKDTAQLIKADVGTEVVAVDHGSWDMHTGYGTLNGGRMQDMAAGLATSLNAFFRDLDTVRSRVTVVTISEFGRRIAENGSRGLDHGWGNMMLLAGAGVRGGRYYGSWTPLGSSRDDDVAVTTDYRDVLSDILARQFPDRSLSTVFPGFTRTPLGVTKP